MQPFQLSTRSVVHPPPAFSEKRDLSLYGSTWEVFNFLRNESHGAVKIYVEGFLPKIKSYSMEKRKKYDELFFVHYKIMQRVIHYTQKNSVVRQNSIRKDARRYLSKEIVQININFVRGRETYFIVKVKAILRVEKQYS